MKKFLVALLACLTVLSLSACGTANCHVCDKEVERDSENKNPEGIGYLCEECMENYEDLM